MTVAACGARAEPRLLERLMARRPKAAEPLSAVRSGLAAGIAGTAVMTAGQIAYSKATGAQASTVPAQVARRIFKGVLRRDLPPQTGWTLHQFRHSALTHLAEDNVQLPLLMAKSRHRSLRTLQRYARPGPDAVAALTAAHDPARRR